MVKGQYLMLSFLVLNNIVVIQGASSGLAYKLAMQWPASFCSTLSTKRKVGMLLSAHKKERIGHQRATDPPPAKTDTCIESPPNQWTIHGLWPKNLYCQESFNIGEISEASGIFL
ncbi:uncharacterized protein LOC111100203 isoform X3 [Crassostrea virginica]